MTPNDEQREQISVVDRYLAGTFNGSFTPEDREEIRQDAFVGLQLKRSREPVADAQAVLIVCARNAALMRLRCADRRRREPFDPLEAEIPDHRADPQDVVLQADEERRVRALIDQLGERERSVLKLRVDLELSTKEIAKRLGLSISRAHRLLKHAGGALVEAIGASELGEFSGRQRSLLAAVAMGIATDRQRKAGAELLEDPHARAILAELRGLGQKAAAVLPLPPVAAAEHSARLSEVATHIKGQLADAAGVTKQHASAAYLRAADPTPLAAARPGAVAATVASCLALGAGGYCAAAGLPDPLRTPFGLQEQSKSESEAKAEALEPPKTLTAHPDPPPVAQAPVAAPDPAPAKPAPAAPDPGCDASPRSRSGARSGTRAIPTAVRDRATPGGAHRAGTRRALRRRRRWRRRRIRNRALASMQQSQRDIGAPATAPPVAAPPTGRIEPRHSTHAGAPPRSRRDRCPASQ